MAKQMSYEVIKLIEHDGRCHITMDVVKGELLINWLRGSPAIEKKQIYEWLIRLAHQMEQYHRCKKNQCYRFLNVYSVVVTKEALYLLDLEAESNTFIVKYMQRQEIRTSFSHPKQQMRSTTKFAIDLYGMGKTMQYILAHSVVIPDLSKKEEYQLSKMIQKCISLNSKNQYKDFKQVQIYISRLKMNMNTEKWKKRGLALLLSAILFAAVYVWWSGGDADRIESLDANQDQIDTGTDSDNLLRQMKEDALQNTAAANKEIIQIGEKLHLEILQYLASAYDRENQAEQAIRVYGELSQLEISKELMEQSYQRRAQLQEQEGQNDAAFQTVKEALERTQLQDSVTLNLIYVRLLCKMTDYPKEEQESELAAVLERIPAIKEAEEYQKMVQEYEIREEGEKVWIGE